MNAYSKDLRLRVLAAVDRGTPREKVVHTFGVSLATIKRYLKRRRETGEMAPKPSPGRTPTIGGTVEQRSALWTQLEIHNEATLEQHCELWEQKYGVKVSISTMSRAIRRLGWTYKKRRWEPPSVTRRPELPGVSG
jgi:transposase